MAEGSTSALTHRIRGEILFGDREIEEARSALLESKRRDPEDPMTWLLIALIAGLWRYLSKRVRD